VARGNEVLEGNGDLEEATRGLETVTAVLDEGSVMRRTAVVLQTGRERS
jgi:hypothetical protein